MRHCKKCGTDKPHIAFAKNQAYCRECTRIYRQANKVKIRALNLTYQAANRERVNRWNRECYARRRAERKVQSRVKYLKYREKILARNKEWQQANPDKCRTYDNNRRALELGAKGTLSSEDWLSILEQYEYRCGYCRKHADRLEQEHRIPLSRGGDHTKANVIPACRTCNARKGTQTNDEYTAYLLSTS